MKHERETLEAVIQARNSAKAAARRAEGDPTDGAAIRALSGAEGVLDAALGKFFALAEAYPDLKANQEHGAASGGAGQHRKPHRLRPSGLQRLADGLQRQARILPRPVGGQQQYGLPPGRPAEREQKEARKAVKVSF